MNEDKQCNREMKASERVKLARNAARPVTYDYIDHLFEKFFPLAGDRRSGEDMSIIGGVAIFHGIPVTVIGHQKGKTLEEKIQYRFGMPNPEGYRKAQAAVFEFWLEWESYSKCRYSRKQRI